MISLKKKLPKIDLTLPIKAFFVLILLSLAQCSLNKSQQQNFPEATYKKVTFYDLKGWDTEKFNNVKAAFKHSCFILSKRGTKAPFSLSAQKWRNLCKLSPTDEDTKSWKVYFEKHFTPYEVHLSEEPRKKGLFTGYFVPEIKGSMYPSEQYPYPIYQRPDDLIVIENLGDFRESLNGIRLAGRIANKKFLPYFDRMRIETTPVLKNQNLEIAWAASLIDLFFLQIQGSGKVTFEDGNSMLIGYAASNGHPYTSIGKFLIDSGEISSDNMSMESLIQWLNNNPGKALELMHKNASYVFFEKRLTEEALGSFGVPVTTLRSLAIDPIYIQPGLPIWLTAHNHYEDIHIFLQKLMFAQDTGGAIKGPMRGDIFCGYGKKAGQLASGMKAQGRYYIFIPNQALVN